ncbi:MAG: 16S rRNA (cytosine(967)-C(5))-methyltransferase RsmB [Clostridia bacterium]|nr:16S rRNA (cytosine(967)-C(5))-methyltransferase RsmB [Clostridia bacterium]
MSTEQKNITARRLAYDILLRCEQDRVYSNIVLDTAIRRHPLSDADRALLTTLVYGVIEKKLTLDFIVTRLADRPLDAIDAEVLVLLRMGLYQLCYLDRIPDHAAVSETVELASRRYRGFVNALLRRYTREGSAIALPDRERSPLDYLSVRYSFPLPLCERFVSAYGFDRAERLLASADHAPALTLRVNTVKTTARALCDRLLAAGYEVTPALHAPHALRVSGGNPVAMPGFDAGEFFVQDEASQLCVEAVGAREGLRVLDMCACPGSKSFGIAIDMKNTGELLAFDLHENKLSLIEKGAMRLGLSNIKTAARDGRAFDPTLEGSADRVLCDVPCSGFGVFAKKPEIRYKDLTECAPLPDIQLAILENACRYVKKGGVLIYSTCTLLPEENEGNVARFLQKHPEFTPCEFTVGDLSSTDGMLTLTPDAHGTDGFFMAKFTKE